MAFYKKMKMKVNGKWYPKSVLVGSAISTEQVAKRVAAESTVSPADVRAVLTALGGVMGDYMAQGRSVKLDGIGFILLHGSNEQERCGHREGNNRRPHQRCACTLHSRNPLPWRRHTSHRRRSPCRSRTDGRGY